MRPIALLLAIVFVLPVFAGGEKIAPSPTGVPETETPGKTIADSELGLAKGSVFDVAVPPAIVDNTSDPGEGPLPPRRSVEWPPVVPHGIADFLPITRGDNACLDCHQLEEKEPGEPTPVPASHYLDLRNSPGSVGDAVAGARWVCVSCHVVGTTNAPQPTAASEAGPSSVVEGGG